MTAETTDKNRFGVFAANVQGTGDVRIPDTFKLEFQKLTSALDWARTFNENRNWAGAAEELSSAARYARELADLAEGFAESAREMRAVAS
jgi:hypothetical protein